MEHLLCAQHIRCVFLLDFPSLEGITVSVLHVGKLRLRETSSDLLNATLQWLNGITHQFNGHEFEQTIGDGEGQGSLVCCSPRGRKELDKAEQLHNNSIPISLVAV